MDCDGIMIVWGDGTFRGVLSEILRAGGYKVEVTGDGEEALRVLRLRGFRPCLMIMDAEFQKACESDATLSKVPKVIMSATGIAPLAFRGERRAENPASIETLLETVTKYIHSESRAG